MYSIKQLPQFLKEIRTNETTITRSIKFLKEVSLLNIVQIQPNDLCLSLI